MQTGCQLFHTADPFGTHERPKVNRNAYMDSSFLFRLRETCPPAVLGLTKYVSMEIPAFKSRRYDSLNEVFRSKIETPWYA